MSITKSEALTMTQQLFKKSQEKLDGLEHKTGNSGIALANFHYFQGQRDAFRDCAAVIAQIVKEPMTLDEAVLAYAKGDYDMLIEEINDPEDEYGNNWSEEQRDSVIAALVIARDELSNDNHIVSEAFDAADQLLADEMSGEIQLALDPLDLPE